MTFTQAIFYTSCIAIQSVLLVWSMLSLHRAEKRLDDVYSLMVKELWSLRGLIERIKSSGSVDKESGSSEKSTATDL